MFIVTNREVFEKKSGFAQFGAKLNPKGSLELRLVEISGKPDAWNVRVLPDKATKSMRKKAGLPATGEYYASHYAAGMLLNRV